MRPEPGGPSGLLARVDARVALLATVTFVVAVVATPLGAWRLLAGQGVVLAFVVGLAGIPPSDLLRRWAGFALLIGFLALMMAPSHPRRDELGAAPLVLAFVTRNSLALLALMTLSALVSTPRMLRALGGLGVPGLLIETLYFMQHYVHVLRDETSRMMLARRSRSFRGSPWRDWAGLGGLLGHLFLRAMERGERVHGAMRARGWDGTLRTLEGDGR